MTVLARIAVATLMLAVPVTAVAHHGWSSYDETKPVTITGPLSQVSWGNPHGTAKMNWRDKQWDVVLAPTSRMATRGLQQGDIDKGQQVTLTGYVRRDGTAEMRIERIRVGDKTIELR